jgi:hypothetical protein
MTLCPLALTAGCRRCPIFSVCPLKSVIGDHKPPADQADAPPGTGRKPRD